MFGGANQSDARWLALCSTPDISSGRSCLAYPLAATVPRDTAVRLRSRCIRRRPASSLASIRELAWWPLPLTDKRGMPLTIRVATALHDKTAFLMDQTLGGVRLVLGASVYSWGGSVAENLSRNQSLFYGFCA